MYWLPCHGIQIQRAQIAPGFIQQVQRTCQECKGEGKIIKELCKSCKGKKRVEQEEILEVHIEKGMKDGQKILFKNKGDQEPGLEAGDIVIVLDEMENEKFTRKDDNLILIMELKLVEALCGCTKYIETLDGRQLLFNLLPGEVIKHDDSRVIQGEGMPHLRHPDEKGDLIVHFKVQMPDTIPVKNIDKMSKMLPGKSEPLIPDDAEHFTMTPVSDDHFQRRRRMNYDDDEMGPGQRVQCQTQ